MKFQRTISQDPSKCKMVAYGFFGNEKGIVTYDKFGINDNRPTYAIHIDGCLRGSSTDFYQACNMLMEDLGVIKTNCV